MNPNKNKDFQIPELNKYDKIFSNEKVRYWEFRKEKNEINSVISSNKNIQDLISGIKEGYSIRVLYKNSWGFVYSEDEDKIKETINKAIKIAKILSNEIKNKVNLANYKTIKDNQQTKLKINPKDISLEEKKELCIKTSKELLKEKNVNSTKVTYHDFNKNKYYQNSENSEITQNIIRTYCATTVISGKGNILETASERTGAMKGYEVTKNIETMGQSSLEKSRILLKAKTPMGGKFPVICDGSLTDVFIHEALGHASEADHVINNDSCLKNKLGQKIAPTHINVFDDATGNSWGSYFYDEEGIKAQNTQIIQNGILSNLLTSRETCNKYGLTPTGNARAQDSSFMPIVRMSNTHIEKGEYSFEELKSDIKTGFYLIGSKGGQVNTKKGTFTFSAEYGYLIKNGEIFEPIKGVSLSGNTLNILNGIDKISKEYRNGSPGMCGKQGQSVPVIGNCPDIRITNALVGGK